jgi:hypothetical protein
VILNRTLWQCDNQTVGAGARVTLDGSTLAVTPGGFANFTSPLLFGPESSTIQLDHGRLIHATSQLALMGNSITGSGDIIVGSAGIDLGSADHPGSLLGTGKIDGLVVYGDVGGSGYLKNVNLFGNVAVGDSAGVLSLENVAMLGGSMLMEIGGVDPASFDRLILGPGVDFGGSPVTIAFVPGFAPNPDDTFQLFTAQMGTDLFASLGSANIDVPADWVLDRATGQLTAVPEPSTFVLLGMGAFGLLGFAWRRKKLCWRSSFLQKALAN